MNFRLLSLYIHYQFQFLVAVIEKYRECFHNANIFIGGGIWTIYIGLISAPTSQFIHLVGLIAFLYIFCVQLLPWIKKGIS